MPKSNITFVCTECGVESLRWAGQCPHCRAWNTLQEVRIRKTARASQAQPLQAARATPVVDIDAAQAPRTRRARGGLNRALGGGVAPGRLVLSGGEPGVGAPTPVLHPVAPSP